MILSIDLDGTLIGEETSDYYDFDMGMIVACIEAKDAGHCLILNTCREGEELAERVNALKHVGLGFDYVNRNKTLIYQGKPTSTKIYADFYYDNKSFNWDRAAAIQHLLSITRDPKSPAKFVSVPVYIDGLKKEK